MYSPKSKNDAIQYSEEFGIKKAAKDLDLPIKSLKRWLEGRFK